MLDCNEVYFIDSSDNDPCLVRHSIATQQIDYRTRHKLSCRQRQRIRCQQHRHRNIQITQQEKCINNKQLIACTSYTRSYTHLARRGEGRRVSESKRGSFSRLSTDKPTTQLGGPANRLILKPVFLGSLLLFVLAMLVTPTRSSEMLYPKMHTTTFEQKNPQCKSQFPVFVKRIEGAVLSSVADASVNCTFTFRTRSQQQIFIIRFEELKLGCDDHLILFDGDSDYSTLINDFSCKDSLARTPVIKTTGTFLTMRYSTDNKAKQDDGFRLVITAIIAGNGWECSPEYSLCSNNVCISRSLFCDDVNHCSDNSDEIGCNPKSTPIGSSFEFTISNALVLLVILIVVIFICVIIFMAVLYCWPRESHYAQYQHHLQRAIGVPLQTSSSLMFANHQPQYHYFQTANLSPYVTPQHNAALVSTLPRGYSTLPLNLAAGRQAQVQQHYQQQQLQQKNAIMTNKAALANNIATVGQQQQNNEYLMMTGLSGPPTAAMQAVPTMQTNLILPTSQSILTTGGIRYQAPLPQEPRRS